MTIEELAPAEWSRITLGDLTATTRPICYGVLKPGPDVSGGVPLVRIQDLKAGTVTTTGLHYISDELDEEFARSRLVSGEVLISIQGTIGRIAICPPELAGANISRTIAVIQPDERVRPEFLAYYLRLLGEASAFPTQGATRASLNIGALRKVVVPAPTVEEQDRIVESLDQVEALIDQGVEQMSRAARSIPSYLGSAMAETFDAPWPRVPLSEVAALSSGGTPSRGRPEYFGGDIPWVKIGDLTEGEVEATDENITERGLAESSAELLEPGVVLLAMYGASIGRTGVLAIPAATNQAICAMRPDEAVLDAEYLFHYLRYCKPTFVAAGYGGAQPNISQRFLKEFPIPLAPLDEQREGVARVIEHRRTAEGLATVLGDAQKRANELRRSLLHRAMAESTLTPPRVVRGASESAPPPSNGNGRVTSDVRL